LVLHCSLNTHPPTLPLPTDPPPLILCPFWIWFFILEARPSPCGFAFGAFFTLTLKIQFPLGIRLQTAHPPPPPPKPVSKGPFSPPFHFSSFLPSPKMSSLLDVFLAHAMIVWLVLRPSPKFFLRFLFPNNTVPPRGSTHLFSLPSLWKNPLSSITTFPTPFFLSLAASPSGAPCE